MGLRIVIPGRFAGMNEYIKANRVWKGKWNKGNALKQADQQRIRNHLPGVKFDRIFITYTYYEIDRRRDLDNISGYFHKVFTDALVQHGCIENDGWKNIKGMADYFDVDKENPRIEIEINEV